MESATTTSEDKVMTVPQIQRLNAVAQNYDWGRQGSESEVAQLMKASGQEIDPNKPYAELWMGTHPSGPSRLADGTELLAFIRDYPETLGDAAASFGADLPFLLKILSVNTALSIQAHPDKALAQKLNFERPNIYKDANHKPEMAVALTDFQALCGFVGHEELTNAFRTVPELAECCGTERVEAYTSSSLDTRKEALQHAFTALMTADAAAVKHCVERLCTRLQDQALSTNITLSPKESLAIKLHEQYPGDVGVLAAFFLNFITLCPGEAIYLAANEPHAYISGEIVECMATSDNVIRAGLTPKLRDTDVLCSCLTYSQGIPDIIKGEHVLHGSLLYLTLYRPPFEEFEVWKLEALEGIAVHLPASKGPLIMLVQHGEGTVANKTSGADDDTSAAAPVLKVKRGDVCFVPARSALSVTARTDMEVWFAAANSMGFFFK